MTIIQEEWFNITQCRKNPNNLYIFGDNLIRKGKKGQAIIRDCSNSYGIATKKLPSMSEDSFFEDTNECAQVLYSDLHNLIETAVYYDNVVFPKDGLGTGLARMPQKAPKLFQELCIQLEKHFGVKMTENGFNINL